jgi:hypothetical protein
MDSADAASVPSVNVLAASPLTSVATTAVTDSARID